MDSFFARNRLSAYLDRSLPKAEAEAVSEAIARDISLSADLQSVQQALNLLHHNGKLQAPNGFQARCLAVIAEQPVPGSQVAWLQRRIARIPTELVALVGAAIIVGFALYKDQPEAEASPVASQEEVQPEPQEQATNTVPESIDTPDPEVPPQATPPPQAKASAKARPKKPSTNKPQRKAAQPRAFTTTSPLAYRILHGGDQVLYDIAAIASSSGGRLVDVNGKIYAPHSLNEARSFSQLYLVTPIENAAGAHDKLTIRSGMSPYPLEGPKPPMESDEFVFLIEAQL